MKNALSPITEAIKQLQSTLEEKKTLSIQKLEGAQKSLGKEIDKQLEELYRKKDQLKEAFLHKRELQKHKLSFFKQIVAFRFRLFISIPFIYSMIVPAILLHVFLEVYHQICFRLYKIPRVRPSEYFIFDRHHLSYLNWFEKFNCMYCSYFNNLVSYTREIAGRTERYWCPIKHAQRRKDPHNEYENFFDYLDGKNYREKHVELRNFENTTEKCFSPTEQN